MEQLTWLTKRWSSESSNCLSLSAASSTTHRLVLAFLLPLSHFHFRPSTFQESQITMWRKKEPRDMGPDREYMVVQDVAMEAKYWVEIKELRRLGDQHRMWSLVNGTGFLVKASILLNANSILLTMYSEESHIQPKENKTQSGKDFEDSDFS